MDFAKYADGDGYVSNPFAAKTGDEWIKSYIEMSWLNEQFGYCETLNDCAVNTESVGLKLFFEYLKAQQ